MPGVAPIAILVTGDPVESARERYGGFADLIARALPDGAGALHAIDCRLSNLPDLDAYSALIVTGSPASVTERAPWMLATADALRRAVERDTPVLGICFGHQLLAEALGGRVEPNPRGREMGTVELELVNRDPLLGAKPTLTVNMSHVDSVVGVPSGAVVLAQSEREPNAAIRFTDQAYGVQFHPEFDADVMRRYIDARRDVIAVEGLDPDAMWRGVEDAPDGAEVLARFVRGVSRS